MHLIIRTTALTSASLTAGLDTPSLYSLVRELGSLLLVAGCACAGLGPGARTACHLAIRRSCSGHALLGDLEGCRYVLQGYS